MLCPDIFAVIVTYNPELNALDRLLSALLPQVGAALIVDNGSTTDVGAWFRKRQDGNCELHLIGANCGIAAAQNIGVAAARRRGADFVLLSDQDSLPAADMVGQLREAARRRLAAGQSVAAMGPRFEDSRRKDLPPFTKVRGLRMERLRCAHAETVFEVDHVIASGCLIPLATLTAVGGMKEDLFIDYVDIEWCLRARTRGFRSYGVCAARMEHTLGESPVTFLGIVIPLHSPLRHYYHVRNAVWLYKQRAIPIWWRLADGLRLLRRYCFYSLFAKPQMRHFSMMTIGVFHGLVSRLGKYE